MINVSGTVRGTNLTSISVGDGNTINLMPGTTVTTTTSANTSNGSMFSGTGPNTIELGRNNTLNIAQGASVSATSPEPGSELEGLPGSAQSEAINVMGFGNTIINRGTIFSNTSAAIWLQNNRGPVIYQSGNGSNAAANDALAGNTDLTDIDQADIDHRTPFPGTFANMIYNYGIITALTGVNLTASTQAIGQSANDKNTLFVNEVGAKVEGNVTMGGADDTVALFTGSTITGSLNGGAGEDTLVLDAIVDPDLPVGTLDGSLTNFEILTKLDDGEWVITGPITTTTGSVTATVEEGTLTLTGENTNFRGTMTVDDGAVLQIGRGGTSGSFAASITDDGIVAFNRSNALTHSNVISGSGQVGQIGTGTLMLTGNNTYTGGTFINSGTLNVSSDGSSTGNPLGAVNGPLTFNAPAPINTIPNPGSPATFQFGASFNLAPTRAITIDPGVGTFDTQGFTSTITQGITGQGALAKIGSGTLILNGDSTYSGGTTVGAGTLVVGDPPPLGTVPTNNPSAKLSGGGPIFVAAGATLGGFGSVTGTVTNAGTVAAGNATPGFSSAAAAEFAINGNLFNEATVNLASDPVLIGNVLRVNGNYSAPGENAALFINTFLNAGGPLDAQLTDRLLVAGSASGTTAIMVMNPNRGPGGVTGLDADNGISIVQVAGTVSPSAFELPGGYVTGSTPYQYHLNAFGPGLPNGPADPNQTLIGTAAGHTDFRLQLGEVTTAGEVEPEPTQPGEVELPETPPPGPDGVSPPGELEPTPPGGDPQALPPDARPAVAPQVPSYISTPRALFEAGFLDLDMLHRRLGEIRDDQILGRTPQAEVFVRSYGGFLNYTTNRDFTDFGFNFQEDYGAVQFGANYMAVDNNDGTLRVGLAGTFGRLWLQPSAVDGPSKALFNTQSLAGIATWQDRSGWYVDGIVMGGLFDGITTTPARGRTAGINGTSLAVSLESGIPIPLPWWKVSFEPQAQLVFQHLSFDKTTDVDGIAIDMGSPDQGVARLGFRLTRPFQNQEGMRFTPYLKANVLQGIGGSSNVVLSGVSFGTGALGTALQVGGGVTGTLTRHLSLYGDVAWQSNVANDGGFRGWVLNGGLRYTFGEARPTPPPIAAAPVPAPAAARTYLVFFDWDQAALTDRARQIIREAAENSTRVAYTRIEVNGYTDTSGTPRYNQTLSVRRAQAVADELLRDGVPLAAISIRGFGQTHLLVPTGAGVREPQNRRVEIILL